MIVNISVYIYYIIWVNYKNSLTWIKAIWGWFPLLTMIPGLGRSEVVMKFTQILSPFLYSIWQHSKSRWFDVLNKPPGSIGCTTPSWWSHGLASANVGLAGSNWGWAGQGGNTGEERRWFWCQVKLMPYMADISVIYLIDISSDISIYISIDNHRCIYKLAPACSASPHGRSAKKPTIHKSQFSKG